MKNIIFSDSECIATLGNYRPQFVKMQWPCTMPKKQRHQRDNADKKARASTGFFIFGQEN
jgi:hypothetical protein